MNRILLLNTLSKEGLGHFGKGYTVGKDISGPDAILVRSAQVETDAYPNLLAVARAGAGVNNITVDSATKKGIAVFNTPGANANAVAELVYTMLGMHARKVHTALSFVRPLAVQDPERIPNLIEERKAQFRGFELAGKTIGIIGLGKIGVLVANAGVKLGMRVLGFDAFPTLANMHALDQRVVLPGRMSAVLGDADIVTVHVPLLKATRGLIGESQLLVMKEGAVLLNYSRDGICDDRAVIQALLTNRLSVYITDFATKELLENEKVICTPHLGASTTESESNCSVMAVRELKQYLEYGIVTNSVNLPTLEVFPHAGTRTRLAIINQDTPGMIAKITGVLGKAGINISAFANESNGTVGYNLVDLDSPIEGNIVELLWRCEGVLRVRTIQFPNK